MEINENTKEEIVNHIKERNLTPKECSEMYHIPLNVINGWL